ncbi:MAG: hypothetical protein V7L22_13030 [Nostoc sp.]
MPKIHQSVGIACACCVTYIVQKHYILAIACASCLSPLLLTF